MFTDTFKIYLGDNLVHLSIKVSPQHIETHVFDLQPFTNVMKQYKNGNKQIFFKNRGNDWEIFVKQDYVKIFYILPYVTKHFRVHHWEMDNLFDMFTNKLKDAYSS